MCPYCSSNNVAESRCHKSCHQKWAAMTRAPVHNKGNYSSPASRGVPKAKRKKFWAWPCLSPQLVQTNVPSSAHGGIKMPPNTPPLFPIKDHISLSMATEKQSVQALRYCTMADRSKHLWKAEYTCEAADRVTTATFFFIAHITQPSETLLWCKTLTTTIRNRAIRQPNHTPWDLCCTFFFNSMQKPLVPTLHIVSRTFLAHTQLCQSIPTNGTINVSPAANSQHEAVGVNITHTKQNKAHQLPQECTWEKSASGALAQDTGIHWSHTGSRTAAFCIEARNIICDRLLRHQIPECCTNQAFAKLKATLICTDH